MLEEKFSFNILKEDGCSRVGKINTKRGKIDTPTFMTVGTQGTIKAAFMDDIILADAQIILSNTYHLMLQPSSEVIAAHGGLHKFMNWKGPMLTDSGGFQIFSLGHGTVADEIKGRNLDNNRNISLIKVLEDGALFKSYIDGSNQLLSPEKSINLQRKIGADLILVLDECTPFHVDKIYTANSMKRSHRWSKRSINSFQTNSVFNSCNSSALNIVYFSYFEMNIPKLTAKIPKINDSDVYIMANW